MTAPPALAEVTAWAGRSHRPAVTVGISPSGDGPLAGLTDLTVPDPERLLSLLREIIEDVPAPGRAPGAAREVAA